VLHSLAEILESQCPSIKTASVLLRICAAVTIHPPRVSPGFLAARGTAFLGVALALLAWKLLVSSAFGPMKVNVGDVNGMLVERVFLVSGVVKPLFSPHKKK
jgi:hypothetical protein